MSSSSVRRDGPDRNGASFFDTVWRQGTWSSDANPLNARRFDRMAEFLADRRYQRALEVGCGDGEFTRRLSGIADYVLGIDVAKEAIERARRCPANRIDFRVENVMELDLRTEGPWDLVVMSETMPYLGWLYSFFDVGWLAARTRESTSPGGRLLHVITCRGVEDDWLYRPWLVLTYRDLFTNVGYEIVREERLEGVQGDTELEYLLTLYEKPMPAS